MSGRGVDRQLRKTAAGQSRRGTGKINGLLRAESADPDRIAFPGCPLIADVDVVAAGRQVEACFVSFSDVVVAARVVIERVESDGRIAAARLVIIERFIP